MKETLKRFIGVWKSDYNFKIFASSAISAIIGLAFTLYNGFLGIYYSSVWNGVICVYYVLLAAVRTLVVNSQIKARRGIYDSKKNIRGVYLLTHIFLLAINISLIVPITVMIKGGRAYDFGMIPAISMAAYTTYRVTMAVINFKKSRKTKNLLIRELRSINLIDALVAVLLLQNTLIVVNEGGVSENMKVLSIISSTAIWVIIAVISVKSFVRIREINGTT